MNKSVETLLGTAIRLYLGDHILKKIAEKKDDWFFEPLENIYLSILTLQVIKLCEEVKKLNEEDILVALGVYHDYFAKTLIENGGFIQDINDSSIICLYGLEKEKNGAFKACKAAINCIYIMSEYNDFILKKYNIQNYINIGIGISTGIVSVGNIGSKYKIKYCAIGNEVNNSSKISSLNKMNNTNILISERTYNDVKSEINFIDKIENAGIENINNIYSIDIR